MRLTLGLMGLDELHLRVLATSSEDLDEKRNAQTGIAGLYLLWLPLILDSIEVDGEGSALGPRGTRSFTLTQI